MQPEIRKSGKMLNEVFMIKRIFLFLVLNFLVVLMISVILNLLNVRPYIQAYGLDYQSLLIFCFVWGMGGAFISLSLSRIMAKWMMGVRVIDPHTKNLEERHLLDLVHRLAQKADLPAMPEVGIYSSNEVNAFATGPTQKRSLVAVSTGLLNRMDTQEVEGVIGHELSHVANGDMVTMTLLQGVVNAFVMFLARVLAFFASGLGRDNRESRGSVSMSYVLFVYLFEVIFMLLGSLVVAAYSRYREFRADAGGAHLAGKQAMISSLQKLRSLQEVKDPRENPAMAAFKISHPGQKGLLRLFASHPPLEERIEKLKEL